MESGFLLQLLEGGKLMGISIYGKVSMKHAKKAKVHVWFPLLCDSLFCTNRRHHKHDAQNSRYLSLVKQHKKQQPAKD